MDRASIEKRVLALLSAVLKQELENKSLLTREHLASWDSLKHISIMFALEDEFLVIFTEKELAELDSFEKIVDVIGLKDAS